MEFNLIGFFGGFLELGDLENYQYANQALQNSTPFKNNPPNLITKKPQKKLLFHIYNQIIQIRIWIEKLL
jgi:hypothetical protein